MPVRRLTLDERGLLGYAVARTTALTSGPAAVITAPFYERLGHRGDPCPQPHYPTFELEFPA